MNEIFEKLKAVIPLDLIRWRVGQTTDDKTMGRALPYIDARVVQNRLDDAVGPLNWKNAYVEVFTGTRLLAVRCILSIRAEGGEWVAKEDVAYLSTSSRSDTDAENNVKGVYSDALKRAAVQWGVARHLYDFRAPWVPLVDGRLAQIPSLYGEAPTDLYPAAAAEAEPAAHAPAVVAEPEVPTPVVAAESAEPAAESAASAPVEQGAEQVAQSPAKTAEPEAPAASAPAESQDDEQVGVGNPHFAQIVDRIIARKVPMVQLRQYVQGPRGKEKFSAREAEVLLKKMVVAEAQPAPAAA